MARPLKENISLASAAMTLACPRCGKGKIFSGLLSIKDICPNCFLNLKDYQTDDGPAFFVMLPLCLVIAICALWLDVYYLPPMWVHLLLWPPIIIILSLLTLRPVKALLMAIQHKYQD